MRILITNDDSISSQALLPLVRWAKKLGEVVVAVPKYEQSGKSHGIEIHKPFEVRQVDLEPGVTAYTVDSTPADCVRVAVLGMHQKFDLVISGINKGLNIGFDIVYSGTAGAAFEAAGLGINALAISTDPTSFGPALENLDRVYDYIMSNRLLEKNPIYNINIPLEAGEIRITRQGAPYYSDDFSFEDTICTPHGKCVYVENHNYELDTDATLHGYISITPLGSDRTNMDVFRALSK